MIVVIEDDFRLDRIADSGQCFRWEPVQENIYRILASDSCLYIEDLGQDRFRLDCTEDEYEDRWSRYFDLDENYAAVRARIDPADCFLCRAAEAERGIRILRQDPWEVLISFIVSQNKNIPAIKHSVELLSRAAGTKKIDNRGCEYYTFPSPAAIASMSGDELKACRLGYRCGYVRAAAEAVEEKQLDLNALLDADEETTVRTLTGLYGVGIKVASCVSLFGLHHINAFPVDVWIRRILENEYPQGYPGERYSPYNGIYQQYMFAYYRKHFEKKKT